MKRTLRNFTPQEKVTILKRHLVEKVPIADLCDECDLNPVMFHGWQEELFENAAQTFESDRTNDAERMTEKPRKEKRVTNTNSEAQRPDEGLVCRFFRRFSKFECMLKRCGFVRSLGGRAQADWNVFAKSVADRFGLLTDCKFTAAVRKLRQDPPRVQVVRDGKLRWEAQTSRQKNGSEAEYAIHLVKTVRNNLFHGGKYPDGPIKEVARDRELVHAALVVLEGLYELAKHVGPRAKKTRR